MLTSTLRHLHPGQVGRSPTLFMMEVTAALLSVLAVRDSILASPAVSFEAVSAAGLWGLLILVAACLAIRDR
jgi:hypothetical protein